MELEGGGKTGQNNLWDRKYFIRKYLCIKLGHDMCVRTYLRGSCMISFEIIAIYIYMLRV